jgi:hypothetical protein
MDEMKTRRKTAKRPDIDQLLTVFEFGEQMKHEVDRFCKAYDTMMKQSHTGIFSDRQTAWEWALDFETVARALQENELVERARKQDKKRGKKS